MIIASEPDILEKARDVAEFFSLTHESHSTLEELESKERSGFSPPTVLVSLGSGMSIEDKTDMIHRLKEIYARTLVLAVVPGGETNEDRELLEKAGVNRFILLQELKATSKLYYMVALLVLGSYLPIPVTDLFPSTEVRFTAYHKLPLNQRFLPVIFSGFPFSDVKYRKLEEHKQIYVRREELAMYRNYVEYYNDKSGVAMKRRTRALMMDLMRQYSEIALLLTLDSEAGQDEKFKEQIDVYLQICQELQEHLVDCPDVWNVISQALDFEFCKYERGPFCVAYALYISAKAGVGNTRDLQLALLFADLGLMDLSPEVYKTYLKRGDNTFQGKDLEDYRHHPMNSLNRVLLRQIDVSDAVKSIISCTHERWDEKGFPNQVPKDKLPTEAQMILFCEILDRRLKANLSDGSATHDYIRKTVWDEEKASAARFSPDFLDKIQKVL